MFVYLVSSVAAAAAECGDPQTHCMIVSLLLMPARTRSLFLSAKKNNFTDTEEIQNDFEWVNHKTPLNMLRVEEAP